MDERWYVETQSDFVSARRELIMLCMAMAVVPDAVAKDVADKEGLEVPPPFQPLTLELDSGDEGYFVDGYREKNLNSPDSNDSGIQADALSFRHLLGDLDLYGVVKKPKRKTVTNTTEDHYQSEESVERSKELLDLTSTKSDDITFAKANKPDEDPYSMVEFVSPDEASIEPTYSMIQTEKIVLKINEQNEDADADDDDEVTECDDNGNHFSTNGSNRKDNHDKSSESSDLPEGWQKHEDDHGSYFWHIKSGITQRHLPSPVHEKCLHTAKTSKAKTSHPDMKVKNTMEKDLQELSVVTDVKVKPRRQTVSDTKPSSHTRFLVRCLGSLPLARDQLSDDRSGRAISRCISSLSHQPSESLEAGRLQGQNLSLEFSEDELLLTDISTNSLVHSDRVKSIRVWGVGREKDSQDFAYVARDPASNEHLCWVFKCERSGDEIATALRSVCLRILKESERFSGKKSNSNCLNNRSGNHLVYESRTSKELPKNQSRHNQSKNNWNDQSKHRNDCNGSAFPLPMKESKKVIGCHYLGMMKVPKPLGMDILNEAIEMIYAEVPSSKWVSVLFEVAPSAVRVYDRGNADSIILECRIRFLTFLGIGINNCRLGAFVMHSAENEFFAHVFHCSPDAGLFCQTIRAACKLRYQKCLDSESQKDQKQNKIALQTSSMALIPFQGLKESLQKGIRNLFKSNGKQQQLKG